MIKSFPIVLGVLVLLACGLLAGSCQRKSPEVTVTNVRACDMLSNADIQAVQGEAVADTQNSEHSAGMMVNSQCFYRLPTFNRSINLEIMHPDVKAPASGADEFWKSRFQNGGGAEADEEAAERKQEVERSGGKANEDEKDASTSKQQPVSGLGDEAFWVGSQINGSLYVRKGDAIIRVSIGGPDDQPTKIQKARTLAESVLKKL